MYVPLWNVSWYLYDVRQNEHNKTNRTEQERKKNERANEEEEAMSNRRTE